VQGEKGIAREGKSRSCDLYQFDAAENRGGGSFIVYFAERDGVKSGEIAWQRKY